MKRRAYVGCRTTRERNARGDGIEVYDINLVTGEWSHVTTVSTLENPSYLTFDKSKTALYTVHGDTTKASAFSIDKETGIPTYLNSVDLGGKNPVYLIPDHTNTRILFACLGSGNIVAVERNADGSLGDIVHEFLFPGNDSEVKTTCPHQICYDRDENYLLVSLKGPKKSTYPAKMGLSVFHYDISSGFLELSNLSGRNFDHCRQLAIHPNNRFVYQLNELHSCIISLFLDSDTGKLIPFQVSQTLPDSCVDPGRLLAGTVCLTNDGHFLYASNRGHDSIAIFSIDQVAGKLTAKGWIPSMGKCPRFISIDPESRYLYGANENSDTIMQYQIEADGSLTFTNRTISTGSPVCIVFD